MIRRYISAIVVSVGVIRAFEFPAALSSFKFDARLSQPKHGLLESHCPKVTEIQTDLYTTGCLNFHSNVSADFCDKCAYKKAYEAVNALSAECKKETEGLEFIIPFVHAICATNDASEYCALKFAELLFKDSNGTKAADLCTIPGACFDKFADELTEKNFGCVPGLHSFGAICVKDVDRWCYDEMSEAMEDPSKAKNDKFCASPCSGAFYNFWNPMATKHRECLLKHKDPPMLNFLCTTDGKEYCLPQLKDAQPPQGCPFSSPLALDSATCDANCTASLKGLADKFGCCAEVYAKVSFGEKDGQEVVDWSTAKCSVSGLAGCKEKFTPMTPIDTSRVIGQEYSLLSLILIGFVSIMVWK